MAESTSNIEFAHKIHEHGHHPPSPSHHQKPWVEVVEAVVLAIVAIATAWSGYQAAKWDALSAQHYSLESRTTVLSQVKVAMAGQERLYDIMTFNAWLDAKLANKEKLAAFHERRFRPEYATAFAAWMKLDPRNNPSAPPGPTFMPEYSNRNTLEAEKLAEEAKSHFELAVSSRETGDRYVKVTVLLATVLLLTALSQRFEQFGPRTVVLGISAVMLVASFFLIVTFPRA